VQVSTEEVKEALECLYNSAALARARLATRIPEVSAIADPPTRAQRLRSILLDAIELLEPAPARPANSPAGRSYEVLYRRFIEGLSVAEIADELHVSRRQAYRDLDAAVEGLAEFLRSYPWQPPPEKEPSEDPLLRELQHVPSRLTEVNVAESFRLAMELVKPLAQKQGKSIRAEVRGEQLVATADSSLLSQLLVQMLGAAIRSAASSQVTATADREQETVRVTVQLPIHGSLSAEAVFAQARALAEAQHLGWREEILAGGQLQATLSLPSRERRVLLVIEDNPEAVELYRRYLSASDEWQLMEAPDPRISLELARRLRPAAIVLDILMARESGWKVLQTLRLHPDTARVPIIVCSVFDDQDLGAALGATAYLKKPVSQLQFLGALQRCLR